MTPKIFDQLEFHKIQDQVASGCRTDIGRALVDQMAPSKDLAVVLNLHDESEQARQILELGREIPLPRLKDISQSLRRLAMGAYLNGPEIAGIGLLLISVSQIKNFFDSLEEDDKVFPALAYWVESCDPLEDLLREIRRSLSEDGEVLSSASKELGRIRQSQARLEEQIRQQLNQYLKDRAKQLSDRLITVRNDRYVLPVKADFKGNFPGTVHDRSASGQTLYIEPQAVVSLNNRRADLQVQEKDEIARILALLSQSLMPELDNLSHNQDQVGQIDFIQARALYAQAIQASRPSFSKELHVALWQARHPLIDDEAIVANDILIGDQYKALIITGPNTGGKTLLLKTLGLIQLMGQSGLQVPCLPGSQLGLFDAVYADIGDEQSIEQSLSTFSGHLTNIVGILKQKTDQSLILFDELGSGTDPQEGSALAMAILEYLRKRSVTVMATTHYPELKIYAHETPKTINASMEFDSQTLSPTYRLLIGIPGRSNALEISKRLQLPQEILDLARQGISQEDHSLNEMVANLERERRQAESLQAQAEDKLEEADQLYQDLRKEYDRWLTQKDQLEEAAKIAANEKIKEAQEEAEKLIQEIRDLQLEQGENNNIKEHTLIEKKSAFDALKNPINLKKNKVLQKAKKNRKQQERLQVGTDVEVLEYGQRGTILERLSDQEYIVQMGILKMKIPAKGLSPLKSQDKQPSVRVHRQTHKQVSSTLDLRGERLDAALNQLSQYLDQALLAHFPQVTIIHGMGTGALREGVQDFLKKTLFG